MTSSPNLPTLYEYYVPNGVPPISGLSVANPYFTLNNKNITIYSGALHYFRVPPQYWRDRLRKLRAAGLNTVETYVPWNLHEPQIGQYDFGEGSNDMSEFLDISRFLKTAQEEDLLAIVRPGPFICAEWEFGGMPSWLLREKNMKFRTSSVVFMKYVRAYFQVLLQLLASFQFTKGGPIIALQVENEYGSTSVDKTGQYFFQPDKVYLEQLRRLMLENGIKELLLTSDDPITSGSRGSLPDLFQTANFANNPERSFDALKGLQTNKPSMAMEFWTGWFDHWSEVHHTRNNTDFKDVLNRILKYPASVNFYMFHGGTNFGFLNGANWVNVKNREDLTDIEDIDLEYAPTSTSYDYDAPLSEAGDYTEKYYIVEDLIARYNTILTKIPDRPSLMPRRKYSPIEIQYMIPYQDLIKLLPESYKVENLLPMEKLPSNNGSGQSYGYTIYQKNLTIAPNSTLTIKGNIHDAAMIFVDGKLLSPALSDSKSLDNFGFWRLKNGSIALPQGSSVSLDIVVTNLGRVNFGKLFQFYQFKGLLEGTVLINDEEVSNWTVMPVEFGKTWINSLSTWKNFDPAIYNASLYKAELSINDEPQDTFLDMSNWKMGVVFVNGFNLGRYMHVGPQQTLYLPAPLLKRGTNTIIVFEHFKSDKWVNFSDRHIFKTN